MPRARFASIACIALTLSGCVLASTSAIPDATVTVTVTATPIEVTITRNPGPEPSPTVTVTETVGVPEPESVTDVLLVPVPFVLGMEYVSARDLISSSALEIYSDMSGMSTVVCKQYPPPGEMVPAWSTVEIYFSGC